jgi:hypothetical protein
MMVTICGPMTDTLTPLRNALLRVCEGHTTDEALCALSSALATVLVTRDAPHRALDQMVMLMRATINRNGHGSV